MKTLVIVESPTKAKTISKFLSKNYIVKSSFGHLRDLPKSKIGVDVANNFEPSYIISRDKTKVVKELKDAAKKADEILFATDEDREGEAISWHLAHILDIDPEKAKRITFHEITKTALTAAVEHPRHIDLPLVNAQQARRILDRLVGYNLSPFLWRKVAKGLSAGRVQSVAVRLVVEREDEIKNFKPEEYWTITGDFLTTKKEPVSAKLSVYQSKKLDKFGVNNEAQAADLVKNLRQQTYSIHNIEEKKVTRVPAPPFTTSSLQQEANHRLGFSAKQTMRLAQQLYEGVELGSEGSVGLITYMRTDAVNLSDKFLFDAKDIIQNQFGEKFAISSPRRFKNKNKNAQEAHEAIRPTEASRTPDSVGVFLEKSQLRLYELIWKRAVASQMKEAELNSSTIDIGSKDESVFRATGQTIVFEGFLKLYPEKTNENLLPTVKVGEPAECQKITPDQHFTEPPARYSDATLVKALEEYGIGRPSTYAPTIATIEDRGYVQRDDKKKLLPTDISYLVNTLLVTHFPNIVDYAFTADVENSLDEIAEGKKQWQPVIADFYHPFKANLDEKDKELNKKELTEEATDEKCDKCGSAMVIKRGRFGKFFACTNYPECKNTRNYGADGTPEATPTTHEKCDKCGKPMVIKRGRFGAFLGCSNYPECKNIKKIEKGINMPCPKCKEGQMVERRSKRGKIFFGCNRYPDCDLALWDKPTGELCPDCNQPLVENKKGIISCSSKTCSYKKE